MNLAEDGDTPDDASDDKVDEAWEDDIPRRNSTSQNLSQSQKSEASSSASSNERDGKVLKVRKSATLVGLGVNKKVDSDAMELAAEKSDKVMRLDIRQVEASIFIIVDEVTNKAAPGYCLVNKSVSHLIHYRQKNARGSNWRTILPGDSVNYTWEDPFIGRQLMVQAGRNILTPLSKAQTDSNFPGLNPHLLGRSAPTMTKRNNDDKRLEGLTECMKCLPSFGQTAERYTLITLDDVDTRSHEIPLPHGTTGTLIGEKSPYWVPSRPSLFVPSMATTTTPLSLLELCSLASYFTAICSARNNYNFYPRLSVNSVRLWMLMIGKLVCDGV